VKDFLKNNFLVLSVYLLTAFTALYFIVNYEKVAINVYLNQYVGNKFMNVFFYFITYLGDGRVAGVLLLAILLYNVRLGLCSTFSFLTATIVATTLKYAFFADVNRPYFVFQYENKDLPISYVDGVDLHIHNSFPSGHATQVFAILLCLAFASKKQPVKFLFLFAAILTSFSRVYLSQHWLADITAGSIIGAVFSVVYYYYFVHKDKYGKLNKSLFAFKNR
jgi:membrane-associated phospholipid phosphatase